jgi:uncharacterized protein YcaQ
MLDELLYADRRLIDYFDKNLSIFSVEDFPMLFRNKQGVGYAEASDGRDGEAVQRIMPLIRQLIKERGHISAAEIDVDETILWHWGTLSSLPRAALESMYFRGELIIHHKTGTNKSYALMKDHISTELLTAAPSFNTEIERLAWHVKRRIGAVGMLWSKASAAWLGLSVKAPERAAAFGKLLDDGVIFEAVIEGLKDPLYILEEDRAALKSVSLEREFQPRAELIAPLDSLMWDRKLIKALFGFEYTWEIYTPAHKRKYGAYVLPLLYGERLIGRVETVCERKTRTLIIKNIWYEGDVKRTKKLLSAVALCLNRFAKFNGCSAVQNKEIIYREG